MAAQLPILNQPRLHEAFAAARELEAKLRASVQGEVRFDPASRALYAADASNYRATPIGVVLPRNAADVEATITAARELGAPILPRGAGTSLSGQCCNVAVVMDFSKYMRRILSLDPATKTAVVEPGIVLDRVREAAEVHHLTFAPDPATHSRCTIGGMIGNNSCGTHSVMGGTHRQQHPRSRNPALRRHPHDRRRHHRIRNRRPHRPRRSSRRHLLRPRAIRNKYGGEIRRRFPNIPRRVSGYNLNELLPENNFQVARAIVGAEGTLATVLSATLDLMHSPPCRRLAILGFPDPFLAADAVPDIIRFGPIGLEGVDAMLLDFMRRKHLADDDMHLLPEGGAFLLAEFGAESDAEADAQAHALLAAASRFPGNPTGRVCTLEEAPRLWRIRESALGSTVFVPGEPHGWEGWEDAAVAPEKLGSYLRQLWALMKTYNYRSPMYGHFGQGCVHTRINFDLESEPGIRKFRAFLDDATDLVLAHGGSLSGEHGDGRARAALLPKMFGDDLMQAFREFKSLWDPANRMNPAILMEPVDDSAVIYQPDEGFRLGAGYVSKKPETFFQFPDDNGSFGEATLRCVGVGACRKDHPGTMCPSYMVTHEEQHSTRGRAHLLWELLEGNLSNRVIPTGADSSASENGGAEGPAVLPISNLVIPTGGSVSDRSGGTRFSPDWHNDQVREALDLCLSCKACKTECPVNVDVATWKAEFLAHYYEGRSRKLQHYAFGFMDRLAHLSSLIPGITPRLANLPLATPGLSHAIKSILGVAPQRTLPRFAPRSFQSMWRRSEESLVTGDDAASGKKSTSDRKTRHRNGNGKGHDFSRAETSPKDEGASAPDSSSQSHEQAEGLPPGRPVLREAQTVEAPAFRPGR